MRRCLLLAYIFAALGVAVAFAQAAKSVPGNEACASCHAEISKTYSKTIMATASGPAAEAVVTGEFLHKPSGVKYSVYKKDGHVWMSYERDSEKDFRGQRELLYFIGSGVKGRTYLYSVDGFLFEAPINWYSQEGKWNMTPAYTEARESPMNLPSYPSCLNCHTSGMQMPEPGTDNKFAGAPFAHGGITCERCHGADTAHAQGKGTTVNPAKLPSDRRDSICMECHFEGTVAIEQPGKRVSDFQPGERLSDYEHYFLLADQQSERPQAVSQFEALAQSECKVKSGDKMWCGTCHDPHKEPAAAERVAYYRAKCLACHGERFAAKHHADKPDCTSCHMPALPSKDVAHVQATDHRILRYPTMPAPPQLEVRSTPGAPLVSFPQSVAPLVTTRDFALAWESLAQRNFPDARPRAEKYLQEAVKELPDDALLLSALAYVQQEHQNQKAARELYERALKIDPLDNEAATNLGILDARESAMDAENPEARAEEAQRAVKLWQGAFARQPHRSAIGMNLAMAFCSAGQRLEARRYVERVLEFNPDYDKAKSLMAHMSEDPGSCKP